MSTHPADAEIRALSRRRFLKTGLWLAGGSVAVLGGTFAFLARSPQDKLAKPAAIHALSDREYHLFAAVCAASLPGAGNAEALLPWTQLPVLENLDRLIADIPAHARGDVAKALQLFDYAPVLSHGKRFADLDIAAAQDVLRQWNAGGEIRRAVSNLVRKLTYIAYWQESASWPAVDYEGPVAVKWGLQRLGNTPLPAPYGVTDVPQGLACKQAKNLSGSITLSADVVVVGSGAGGAVMACELAAAGKKVIILEAGPYVPSSEFREELIYGFKQLYQDQGGQVNGAGDMVVLQGACVGGSTVVNGCVCFRTPDFILSDWQREHGLTELTPENLAPYFEKAERHLSIHDNLPQEINANSHAVIRGADKLGLSWKPIRRNVKDCGLTGFCLAGCATDRKQSMLVTYLPWALANGAELYADTRVTRVLAENGEATGVIAEVIDPITKQKVADLRVDAKVVVVAAGAIQTPLLLQASGLCNGSDQLGRNFACHPSTGVLAQYPEDIHMWRGALLGVHIDEWLHPEKGGFLLEVGGAGPAEISVFVDPGLGAEYDSFMKNAKHYAGTITLIHDHNLGRVYRDENGIKHIDYNLADIDFPAMKAAFKAAARVHFAAGAEKVFLPTVTRRVIEREADIEAMVESIPNEPHAMRLVSYHPQGTARMGADPAKSVVGPRGETHEVKRLFVADASLFPTSMIVNPQLSVYGLAGYIADQVKGHYAGYFAGSPGPSPLKGLLRINGLG